MARHVRNTASGCPGEFGALQSMRAIFALFIFLHHMDVFPAGGDAGVAFFLLLSGFVMTHGYGARMLSPAFDTRSYLRRRLARIYPLHLFCLALALAVVPLHDAGGPAALALNMVLMQSWVPLREVFFSGNAVAWCLSDLLFFYAVFPYAVRLSCKLPHRLIAAGAAVAIAVYAAVLALIPGRWMLGVVYVNPLMRFPDFLLGMALYGFWRRCGTGRPLGMGAATATEAGAWLLFALWTVASAYIPEAVVLASWWWPPSILLVLVFSLPRFGAGLAGRLLRLPWLVRAGELSFSFYMVHQLVIRAVARALDHWNLDLGTGVCITVAFTASVAMTWLVNRFVEIPLRRWLLRQK